MDKTNMGFLRYQHVERFGTTETSGIDIGMCYVFPKIDGTNAQLWFDSGLQAGSRNRHLSTDNDNAGFYCWALKQNNIAQFFNKYPHLRLFGEWLVPHTLKTYHKSAWDKFYVFDVMDGKSYLHYETYKTILDEFDIEYIPPICKVLNPSYERLVYQLENNGYLIQGGKGSGEGIVIKNYEYKNKFGRVVWAKIVKNELKAKHSKCEVTEIKESKILESIIVDRYVTNSLIEKEFSKIDSETGWSSKQIPRLVNTVYYCLVKEECWNFVKEHKNPSIDFKRLMFFTINKIKEEMPQIFNDIMTEPTEITTLQKRINTLAGLIDELKQLYIKVGVMYIPTNGDTLIKNKEGKYPLYISRQAAEKDYPYATVVELELVV